MPPGSWKTEEGDKDGLAPHCRIQRRVPSHNWQVHASFGDVKYSKVFSWNPDPDGKPSMQDMLEAAVSWSWKEWSDFTKKSGAP